MSASDTSEEEENQSVMHFVDTQVGDCRRVSSNSDEKATLIFNLNSKTVKFELDTGSTLTAISDCAYNTIFSDRDASRLKPANVKVRVANGSIVDNVKICHVSIDFKGRLIHKAPLHVVSGLFPCILGLDSPDVG